MRSNLLAEELARRGHKVMLWVSAFDHNAKKWAIAGRSELLRRDNIRVVVLKGTGYKKNVSLARFIDHRVLSFKFKEQSNKEDRPDVIITSLPPHDLAYQSIKYARKNRVPAIVDIRDPWPDIFLENLPNCIKSIGRVLLRRDFQMVKRTMRDADSLVAVSNSFLDWGLCHGRRTKSEYDRVFYLGYHRPDSSLRTKNVRKEFGNVLNSLGDRKVVTYIGAFTVYHDPSVIVDCARLPAMHDIAFVLAGNGDLYDLISGKAISLSNVYLPGWINQDEIDTLLTYSFIGVCPTTMQVDLFPNKAFMYLSAGLPVISFFQGDLKLLIESEKIGYYVDPGDVEALKEAILTLSCDDSTYEEMSRNASELFGVEYNEEKIYQDFADHVERIAARGH